MSMSNVDHYSNRMIRNGYEHAFGCHFDCTSFSIKTEEGRIPVYVMAFKTSHNNRYFALAVEEGGEGRAALVGDTTIKAAFSKVRRGCVEGSVFDRWVRNSVQNHEFLFEGASKKAAATPAKAKKGAKTVKILEPKEAVDINLEVGKHKLEIKINTVIEGNLFDIEVGIENIVEELRYSIKKLRE